MHYDPVGFIPGCKAAAVLEIQCNPPYKQANEKSGNMVLTTDAEEAFVKLNTHSWKVSENWNKRDLLQLNKDLLKPHR